MNRTFTRLDLGLAGYPLRSKRSKQHMPIGTSAKNDILGDREKASTRLEAASQSLVMTTKGGLDPNNPLLFYYFG